MQTQDAKKWFSLDISEVASSFETDEKEGISEVAAEERLEKFGKNTFKKGKDTSFFDLLLRQIASPLILILIIAGFVTLFLHEYSDSIVIFAAVAINIGIGIFQEYKASEAFKKLQKSQSSHATVIRNGNKKVINTQLLVPGDLVIIEPGMFIPADIRATRIDSLLINESALTGEWDTVTKDPKKLEGNIPPADQENMLFMGTLAVSGSGEGIVVGTGGNTQIGLIAENLGEEIEDTPFQESIKKLARFLIFVILAVLVLIFVLGILRGQPISELLLIAIALAVSAIPEGLPIAVTVVLAFGMATILKRGGLVRNLLAAETLGSTTVILTDKTGTLTEAKMEVRGIITAGTLKGENDTEGRDEVLQLAVTTSDAFIEGVDEEGEVIVRGRPVEAAIVRAGLERNLDQKVLLKHSPELDLLKFSSARRYAASLHATKHGTDLYVVGAPEAIIEHSSNTSTLGKVSKLSKEVKEEFIAAQNKYTEEGERLVAVGRKSVDVEKLPNDEGDARVFIEKDLEFVGFIALHDPVRSDVEETIELAKRAGTRVIMMTGDHSGTAKNVADQTGICRDCGDVLTGNDVEKMTDEELSVALREVRVFARMLPHQKMRVADLLKKEGEVVAMTGDGINDAPALRNADIGIALGSGTEVAKEASDLVLVNNGFSVIVAAIEEGRRILDNLKKIVVYLLSTGFSEIAVVTAALIMGNPLPILPVQILWANIVGEGFMNFAFAFEPKEEGLMERDPKDVSMRQVLAVDVKKLIFIMAGVTGLLVFIVYLFLLDLGLPIEEIRTVIFAAISIASFFFAFSLKDLHKPIWRIDLFSNKYLMLALAISIGLFLMALFFAPVQGILSLTTLSVEALFWVLVLGFTNLILIEFFKYFIFRRRAKIA